MKKSVFLLAVLLLIITTAHALPVISDPSHKTISGLADSVKKIVDWVVSIFD